MQPKKKVFVVQKANLDFDIYGEGAKITTQRVEVSERRNVSPQASPNFA